ncbi:MAG: helix-turn-helix domain-containing protein [Ruminococcaceae bacterium]|nr:helix-turn-helix domain-containing protein [Oscillospiraceae bacterium]
MEFVLKELKDAVSVKRIANVHFFEFEKDFYTENDRHPFCELVFVSRGELEVRSEDYSGKLSKNEMILHRAGEMHSLSCRRDNSPTVIVLGFESDAKELSLFSRAPVPLGENAVRLLAETIKVARQVFAPPYDKPTFNMKKRKDIPFGAEQLLRLLLEELLILLVRDYTPTLSQGSAHARRQAPAIREIITYVDENFLERITISELAFLFKTNRATLCREFKQETGMTLVTYINEKKLALAKERILHSDETFTSIAASLRFESIHYFTRFFKSHTGFTPKEWKKANENKN